MVMDPNDLGQGPGPTGDPAAGTPTPSGGDEAERIRQLEQENAKLRAERRLERGKALVAQHGLTADQAFDLASMGSLNEIEEAATKFAEANAKAGTTPPAPSAGAQPPAPPVPTEPADAAALAAVDGAGEDGVQQPTPASLGWKARMDEEIAKATSLEEIAAIQQKYRNEQMERAQA